MYNKYSRLTEIHYQHTYFETTFSFDDIHKDDEDMIAFVK
jgi:hypothetical protein